MFCQVALSRAFVVYYMSNPQVRELVDWFADTLAPDEYIWPTINHNPQLLAPGGFTGTDKNMHVPRGVFFS